MVQVPRNSDVIGVVYPNTPLIDSYI